METRIMEAAKAWLIEHQDTMRDELIALCNLNSSSDNLTGLATVESYLEEYFSPLGLPIQKLRQRGTSVDHPCVALGLDW